MKQTLKLFMWGYQPHFRTILERNAKSALSAIGFDAEPRVLLVGIRRPETTGPNLVCIEPEFETWPLSLFAGIGEAIETAYREHEGHNMFYTHEQSMREKPEKIRRDTVRAQVKRHLERFDVENGVISFVGTSGVVGDYYVVPILQISKDAIERYPRLSSDKIYAGRFKGSKSFIDNCIYVLLDDATDELQVKEPGRGHFENRRSPDEVVRRAATSFLRTPLMATAREGKFEELFALDLFKSVNEVSSHMYEHTAGIGKMLLINPDSANVQYALRFPTPITFRDSRWARKLLQMAVGPNSLIANGGGIHGLGALEGDIPADESAFWVDFVGHYQWDLRLDTTVIFQSKFGEPSLLIEAIKEERFEDNFRRVLGSTEAQAKDAWRIMQAVIKEPRGSMVVFAEDAPTEAQRLSHQGMAIVPERLTANLLASACRIDGSTLCDVNGICHAMGVILDGAANDFCTPARGSRYNSAIRYALADDKMRLAIVKSEDGTLDVIPLLLPRIRRKEFSDAIDALERATLENYHKPRSYLDRHRFYVLAEDCPRINAALDRLGAIPQEVGEIRLETKRFEPHPAMDSSYYY
jgi:DisA bacterial checkpoint controller nucleotide-binding